MDGEQWYGAAYKGSKQYKQWDIPMANATGFGAAADDYMERGIDLNEQLIRNKPATFFFRMNSEAMTDAGIYPGDVLIVDRSIRQVNSRVIVAILNGELLVRRFTDSLNKKRLVAENKKFGDIEIDPHAGFTVWGVVLYCIHNV
ncbi:MAG: LexA family protein [Sediminibacterium sp.]|nr:translesion error-prone DNA polymerase V autoproteolytic subunit [uncultured Sediminibacterium sp.]